MDRDVFRKCNFERILVFLRDDCEERQQDDLTLIARKPPGRSEDAGDFV
jgi:hypothetical protein